MPQASYYAKNNERLGPVPLAELRSLVTKGGLQPSDLVWSEHLPGWVPARKVRELFPPQASDSVPGIRVPGARESPAKPAAATGRPAKPPAPSPSREPTSRCVRESLGRVGLKTLYIKPGSPWENGYVESFLGGLWDELLKRESFDTLLEAKVLIERWRQTHNTVRPHRAVASEGESLTKKLVPHWGQVMTPQQKQAEWKEEQEREAHEIGQALLLQLFADCGSHGETLQQKE